MSNFWIDIENAAGVKQGEGPIVSAEYWESVARLDRAGTFEFGMPASDLRAAIVQPKLIARCYARVQDNVTEIGAGIIDHIQLTVGAQGQTMLTVSGDDLLKELVNRSVGFLTLATTVGAGVTDALSRIMALAPGQEYAVGSPLRWALDTANGYGSTASNVYAKFAGESVLAALVKVAADRGEHFRLGTGRKVVWLRKTLTASGIRAIQGGEPTALDRNKDACVVLDLEEERDTYDICSRVYPYGNGIGEARLTLAASSKATSQQYPLNKPQNYVERAATGNAYGRIDKYLSFKDITPVSNTNADLQAAADKLYEAALDYLEKHKQPERYYRMQVAKVDKVLLPGQKIRVVMHKMVDSYDVVNIDRDLTILEVTNRIDDTGMRTTGMQVSTIDRYMDSDATAIVSALEEGRVMESYPQMNANAYTVGWYDDMDDSKSAYLDFWLGSEVVNVNQVLLRFQVDALRSTVKSLVASSQSSGQTTTNSSGPSTRETSVANSSVSKSTEGGASNTWINTAVFDTQQPRPGVHRHWVSAVGDYTGTDGAHVHDMSHGHYVNVQSHTHDFSAPTHTHAIDHTHGISHEHTFTPAVSMEYGIFEDSSAKKLREYSNSYKFWDLEFYINGSTTPISASKFIKDGASGWWYLDLTSFVSDSVTFRPLRGYNRLEIRAAASGAGRRARMRGQLTVRTVIQAMAVV